MYAHRGGQPRVVDLNARHAIRDKQFPPFFMHRQAVREQSELFFEEFRPPVRFLRRKSVAVTVEGASTGVPEFADILRRIAKLAVTSKNGFDSRDYKRIIVVVRLDPPEKNVAIDEVRRPCHLAGPHRSFRARSFQSANLAVSPIPLRCLQACGEIPRRLVRREAENSQSKPL